MIGRMMMYYAIYIVYGISIFLPLGVAASPPYFLTPEDGEWGEIRYIRQDLSSVFKCQAYQDGGKDFTYVWTFNGSIISGSKSGVQFDNETGDLRTLKSFDDHNNGYYTCIARDHFGAIMTSSLTLINARYELFPQHYKIPQLSAMVNGNYLQLPCNNVPYSQPPFTLRWKKTNFKESSRRSKEVSTDGRVLIDPEGTLHFLWLEKEDGDFNYSCHGYNEIFRIDLQNTESFLVLVKDQPPKDRPPTIVYNKDVFVKEGHSAKLVCLFAYFSKTDQLNIKWYREDNYFGSGHEVTVHNTALSDDGEYKCKASINNKHVQAKVRLTVGTAPKFLTEQKPEDVVTTVGSRAKFKCGTVSENAQGAPPVWLKDGQPILGCPPDQLECGTKAPNGLPKCVAMTTRCDGNPDCEDGGDEFLCPGTTTRADFPDLPEDKCFPAFEANCSCNYPLFRCKDGSGCLNPSEICNKSPDCIDGSDENACEHSPRVTVGIFYFNPTRTEVTIEEVSYNLCLQCMVSNQYGTILGQACLTVTDEVTTTYSEVQTTAIDTTEATTTDYNYFSTASSEEMLNTETEKKELKAETPIIAIILVCASFLLIICIVVFVLFKRRMFCSGPLNACRSQQMVTTPHSSFLDMYNGIEGTLSRYDQVRQSQLQPEHEPRPLTSNIDHIGPFI